MWGGVGDDLDPSSTILETSEDDLDPSLTILGLFHERDVTL